MARDDYNRRRLRGMYERNQRRVSALADARDRRRGDNDEIAAPRRFVVSERRTRIEGFGRGGRQVRQVLRSAATRGGAPRRIRFRDSGIFRRGGRDRFRREEDFDREMRRDRFLARDEERRRSGVRAVLDRGEGNRVRGGRLGVSRRRRLRMQEEGLIKDGRHRHGAAVNGNGYSGRSHRGNNQVGERNNRRQQQQGVGSPSNGKHRGGGTTSNGGGRRQHEKKPMPTRDELDAQLDRFRNN